MLFKKKKKTSEILQLLRKSQLFKCIWGRTSYAGAIMPALVYRMCLLCSLYYHHRSSRTGQMLVRNDRYS